MCQCTQEAKSTTFHYADPVPCLSILLLHQGIRDHWLMKRSRSLSCPFWEECNISKQILFSFETAYGTESFVLERMIQGLIFCEWGIFIFGTWPWSWETWLLHLIASGLDNGGVKAAGVSLILVISYINYLINVSVMILIRYCF